MSESPGTGKSLGHVHIYRLTVIYCCCLGVSLKIVQLLQHFEHLVQPLAQAVETFVNEFAVKSIVSEVIRSVDSAVFQKYDVTIFSVLLV